MDGEAFQPKMVGDLLADPVFGQARFTDVARLVPHVQVRRFRPGERLCAAGSPAETLFLILDGEVRAETGGAVAGRRVGEEAATDLPDYLTGWVAASDVRALALPREKIALVLKGMPEGRLSFYYGLLGRPAQALKRAGFARLATASVKEVVGWAVTIVVPLLILLFGETAFELASEQVTFLAIFAVVLSMWVFTLVDEFVPCIFAMLSSLVLGLAPPTVVLSGFSSDGFLMAVSILGLATVMVASGVTYRFQLFLLALVPNSRFWHAAVLAVTGILLTPILPTVNGRMALMLASLADTIEELKLAPKGPAANSLTIAMFGGLSLFSAVFMSSKSVNFVVFGLLPPQGQDMFQWAYWLFAASVSGAVLLTGMLAADRLIGRGANPYPRLDKEIVRSQLKLLGRMKNREWAAVFGILVFLGGIATASIHQITPPWMGMAILYALLVFGFLRRDEFHERIDWPSLFYLAGSVGIIETFNHLELDRWVAGHLVWLSTYMRTDFPLFLLILAGVIQLARLVVPGSATIVLFCAVLMPIAEASGINPWLIGFSILTLGEMWFLPYQCSYYGQMEASKAAAGLYDERRFLIVNAAMNGLKILSLYASMPFWKILGLI